MRVVIGAGSSSSATGGVSAEPMPCVLIRFALVVALRCR